MEQLASEELVDLLIQARAGDDHAWGRVLAHFEPYLVLLARLQIGKRLRRKVDPTDLVQDVFLAAHRARHRFRGTTEQETTRWLRKILAARLAKLIRHYFAAQKRDLRLERELMIESNNSSDALQKAFLGDSSPGRQAARRELAVVFANALAQLPPHYREVVIAYHLESVPFADLAVRMGRTPKSVKMLWARALVQLRGLLKDAL